MDPSPLIPVALAVASVAAGLWGWWGSVSAWHARAVSLVAAPLLALAVPPTVLAALLIAEGDGADEVVLFSGAVGGVVGVVSAFLAVPCGVAAASLGRLLSVWHFPPGVDREEGESLAALARRKGGTMTLAKALLTLVSTTLLFAIIGAAGGVGLGYFFPGYYRAVMPGGNRPEFDPVAVGFGLGVSQWAAGGAALGLALVVVLAWYDLRRAVQRDQSPGSQSVTRG